MTGRDRIVLIVVATVAAVAAAWMLVIQPKRSQAQSLQSQVHALQGQLSSAQSQLSSGQSARAQFASDYTQLARLGEALPQDDDVPSLIYEVQSAANSAHVDFRDLQMVPGSATTTTAPSTGSKTGGAVGAQAGAGQSSASSTGASGSSGSLPPGAVVGPAGFPTEQFTFSFTGNFFRLSDFFGRLQRFVVANNSNISVSGRLISINAISLAPGPNGFPAITATVSATTYMAPASSGGLLNGATPTGPAGTTGATTASHTGTTAPAAATITP